MTINGVEVGRVQDYTYNRAEIGFGAETAENPWAELIYKDIMVSVP